MDTTRGAVQAERAANQVACLRFLADADEPRTVGVISEGTGLSRPTVHAVLEDLLDAGLVSREKHGNFARYAIADDGVFELCEQVCGGLRRQMQDLDAVLPR